MTQDKGKINVHAAIVCDDVRTEITGKEILIGVYSSDISIPSTPFNIGLCIWIQWSASIAGKIPFRLRVHAPNNIILFDGGADVTFVSPNHMGTFVIGGLMFQVQAEGHLVVEIKEASHPWVRLLSLPIVVRRSQPTHVPAAAAHQESGQGQSES